MFKSTRLVSALLISAALASATNSGLPGVSASSRAATSPVPGAAANFLVLSGAIVTNTGSTTIAGDLGVSPGIGEPPIVTGFPPGVVSGTIHIADGPAADAQANSTAMFGELDQVCDVSYPGVQDLTLVSPLAPGVYCAAGSFALSGQLVLVGEGVWIFKSASTFIAAAGSSVTGGDPCNVWWRVTSSADFGANSAIEGSILALTSISLKTGATLNGRAMAQTGEVTLDSNTVSLVCNAPTAVELLSFTGTQFGHGVALNWETAQEVDNYGFNLYRAAVDDFSQAVLIHFEPSSIAGGTGSGATYRYVDTPPGPGTWRYWLADVDTHGAETRYAQSAAVVMPLFFPIYLPMIGRT